MQPDRNPAAQTRPTVKRCPDCGEPQPTSAFYERGDGHLSTYCKHHQRERPEPPIAAAARTPTSWPVCERSSGPARPPREPGFGPSTPAARRALARSRSAAARRLIAAHLDEYRALLELERQRQQHDGEVVSGGGPDAA